jgi:membrane protein
LVLAVFSASAGVNHLDAAIRDAYGLPPQRYLEARGRAFLGALAVVLLLGLGAVVVPAAAARLPGAMTLLGVPVALVAITVGVCVLYRFSVGTPVAARSLVPGALAAAVGVVLVIGGFGAYVSGTAKYSAVYGASAGAVIGMLAIYFAVYILLLGAVLNSQLSGGRPSPPAGAVEPPE